MAARSAALKGSGPGEMRAEEGGGTGSFGGGDLFRGALGDDFSAGPTAFGAEVHEVVRLGEDIQVVFNHHYGVAGVDQAVE